MVVLVLLRSMPRMIMVMRFVPRCMVVRVGVLVHSVIVRV